jgi:iron complex outermembrane receptor protein
MKKNITSTLLFIVITIAAFAQTTLKGKVTDKVTGKALEAVNIFIPEYQKSATSNENGEFSFDGVGNGIVRVQATIIGYKSVVQTADMTNNTEVNIVMEPSTTELEEVVVTSNSSKLQDNIPYSVNVVTKSELQATGAPSLMDALSRQPGVDKISLGTGINKPVIRGLSFNRILLYSQGTRVENQQWDDHHDLGISDVGVDKVEIIYGPSALIYGADALGGALIFQDEKPALPGTTVGDANLGFYSNSIGLNADAGVKGAGKSFFYSARFGGQSHVSYHQGEADSVVNGEKEPFAANSKWNSTTAKAAVGTSQTWGVSKLSYSYFNRMSGVIEDETGMPPNPNDEAEQTDRDIEPPYQDVTTHIVSLENTVLTGKSKLNVNVAYQVNDRKEFEPMVDPNDSTKKLPNLAIGLLLNNTTYDIKWSSNADKAFGVTIGSQGLFQENTNNGPEILVPDANVSDVAGFALLRYDLPQWNFLGGFRYDTRHIEATAPVDEDTINGRRTALDITKDYTPVTGSLGLAFHPNEHTTLKANFASGFSAPNYAELGTYGKHEGTYRFEIGNPDLNVEQNTEGDLGIIWENEFVTLHANGFYNKIKDYIYTTPTADSIFTDDGGFKVYAVTQGDATISGGDLGFDIHPKTAKWLDLKATYAMTRGTLDAGGNLPFIPADKIISEVKFSKEKIHSLLHPYVSFVVNSYMDQTRNSEFELPTPGYTLLDVHIGSEFKIGKHNAELSIFCTNVANTSYFSHLSLVRTIGVHEMGRNIGLQFHIPFGG